MVKRCVCGIGVVALLVLSSVPVLAQQAAVSGIVSDETRAALPAALACGALDVLANALYLIATRGGPLGLVATLTSLYPASTVMLARVVLRERLRPVQSLGLACAAAAIVLITSR